MGMRRQASSGARIVGRRGLAFPVSMVILKAIADRLDKQWHPPPGVRAGHNVPGEFRHQPDG